MQALVARVEDEFCEIDKICVGVDQVPIINFKDGTRVIFSWKELCEMAVNFKKKEEEKAKKSPHTDQSKRTKNL